MNGDMSGRELEVWDLVAQGYKNSYISEKLCVEIKTVERHITNLILKTKGKRDERLHPRVWLALNYENGRKSIVIPDPKNFRHGEKMVCPICFSKGKFDLMKGGEEKNEAEFSEAIWFSRHSQEWECYSCWLK